MAVTCQLKVAWCTLIYSNNYNIGKPEWQDPVWNLLGIDANSQRLTPCGGVIHIFITSISLVK